MTPRPLTRTSARTVLSTLPDAALRQAILEALSAGHGPNSPAVAGWVSSLRAPTGPAAPASDLAGAILAIEEGWAALASIPDEPLRRYVIARVGELKRGNAMAVLQWFRARTQLRSLTPVQEERVAELPRRRSAFLSPLPSAALA